MAKKKETSQSVLDTYKGIFLGACALMTLYFTIQDIIDSFISNLKELNADTIINSLFDGVMAVVEYFSPPAIIFACLLGLHYLWWNLTHKYMKIAGKWLHVHEKENIRIGVVDFDQNFSSVSVSEAINISPAEVEDSGTTKWGYTTARLYPQDLPGVEFIATYYSRKANGGTNTGTHIFDSVNLDGKGLPVSMIGKFCDTFEVVHDNIDIADKRGNIYLYRMSKKVRKYLYGDNGFDENKLRSLISDPEFAEEDFVKKVKDVIAHQNKLREEKEAAELKAQEDAKLQRELQQRLECELAARVEAQIMADMDTKISELLDSELAARMQVPADTPVGSIASYLCGLFASSNQPPAAK